jgi:hypothetical protein
MRRPVLFACLLGLAFLPQAVSGHVITVRQDGSGDYLTVTPAIAAAASYDSISVGPGTYAEPAALLLSVPITLFSTGGRDLTILDGQNMHRILTSNVAGIHLKGLGFVNGQGEGYPTTGAGAGYFLSGAQVTIEDCRFRNNRAEVGGAIYVSDQSLGNNTRLEAIGCSFEDNFGSGTAGAVYVVNGAVGDFTDCTFLRNATWNKAGAVHVIRATADFNSCFFRGNRSLDIAGAIFFESSSGSAHSCTFYDHTSPGNHNPPFDTRCGTILIQLSRGTNIYRNIFVGETAGYALRYYQCTDTHSCNVFWDNARGAVGDDSGLPPPLGDDVIANPLFCEPLSGDFNLPTNSPAAPTHSACGLLIGKYPVACGTVPIEVADLAVAASARGVTLSWKLTGEAQRNLQSVSVQRAQAPEGPYVDRTLEGLSPSEAMSFEDTDIAAGQTYWYRLVLVSTTGARDLAGPIRVAPSELANLRTALQVPVVAGETVEIRFTVGKTAGPVQIDVYDVSGHRVRGIERSVFGPGQYRRNWDRRDASGSLVARGVYFIRLSAGGTHDTQKVVLVRQ